MHSPFRPLVALILILPSIASASVLTLDDYLQEVLSQSPGIEAGKRSAEGALEASKEGNLVLAPQLFANAQSLRDEKENPNPLFQGNLTRTDSVSTGVQKQFGIGLNAKLSYSLTNTEISGLAPSFFPGGQLKFTNAITALELSQSLWRNFFGKETESTVHVAESSQLATHYSNQALVLQQIAQAEQAYYRLAIARESVALQRELLDRSKKILDWATKRVNVRLADRIDMLQAKAAFQARELDYQNQLDEERSARLAFNAFRNQINEAVNDSLMTIDSTQILKLNTPRKTESLPEIKAAEQNEIAIVASNELARQKTLPDLSLFGSAAYNGFDTATRAAFQESFSTQNPTYLIGLKLSMPLYLFDAAEVRAGRIKAQLGAEAQTRQKRLQIDQNWLDWNQRFEEAKGRLKLADALVKAQKEKLDYEKYRLNLGRTTTYQALTFEQDYAQSLLLRLRIENEILSIHAQMKTYASSNLN